jgi:hypothetical protein
MLVPVEIVMVDDTTDMKLTVVTEGETARRRLFHQCDCAVAIGERPGLPRKLHVPYSIAFGNQTISVLVLRRPRFTVLRACLATG